MTVVRAALTQTTWTGDKESMLDKHEKFARDAAAEGAQVICFQELFYGPYFGITADKKYYDYAEPVPDGPTTAALRGARQGAEHGHGPADLRGGQPGVYYNTAVVVDADGTFLGKYRKHHIPHLDGFWEKFYFRPGNLATRSSTPRSARSASTSATTATSPRDGARSASTARRSSSTRPPRARPPSTGGTRAARGRRRERLLRRRHQPARHRGARRRRLLRRAAVIDPRGNFVGERGMRTRS